MWDTATDHDVIAARDAAAQRRGASLLRLGGAVALVVLTAGITLGWRHAASDGSVTDGALIGLVALQIAAGLVFLAMIAWWFGDVRRGRAVGRRVVIAMLLIGAAMRVATLPTSPRLEDDYHRYLWDGAIVGVGENPYRWSPQEAMEAVPGTSETVAALAVAGEGTVTLVNHPHLRTIYPPVAQFWFAAAQTLTPWRLGGWRVVLLLHDLATLALLLHLLRRLRLPAALAGIWWINPLVVGEIHQTLHMDVLIVPWMLGAVALAIGSRPSTSSALLAVGAAVKLWPVVLMPLLVRHALGMGGREGFVRALASIIVFAAVAMPLLAPMLLSERGTDSAESGLIRYAEAWQNNAAFFTLHHGVWERLLPLLGVESWWSQQWARGATAILLAVVIGALLWRPIVDGRDLARRGMWIVATVFMIGPTQFPWYFLWLVPLLTIGVDRRGRPCLPLLAFCALLPLYHLQELAGWTLWVQHLPVWMWLGMDALRGMREDARRHAVNETLGVSGSPQGAGVST